jgi:transcriptional regulator with XRE-family HTH domain
MLYLSPKIKYIGTDLRKKKILIAIMTIAERIRLFRQQLKLSQTELAEKANVNIKSLSRYELGNSIPSADVLKAIADALGVTADALLSDEQITIKDKELFRRFEEIQSMQDDDTKNMIIRFLDLAIRDSKAKQAYAS